MMPVAPGQVHTTSVGTSGTLTAVAPKLAKGGWSLVLSSGGRIIVHSVCLNSS